MCTSLVVSYSLFTISQGGPLSGFPCFDRFPNELYGLLASGFRKAPFTLVGISLRDLSCDKSGDFFRAIFSAIVYGVVFLAALLPYLSTVAMNAN